VPIDPVEGIEIYKITLGAIGKTANTHEQQVTSEIAALIPHLEKFLSSGLLKPMEYEVVGDVGVKEVLKGLDVFSGRKGGTKKIVVRLAEE
jgi:hypothetical protein